MGHTYHQNYAHLIFHVDNTEIQEHDIKRLHAYMCGILITNGVKNIVIGGIGNHVHILGDFPLTRTASEIVRTLKSVSTLWLKGIHSCYQNFAWQHGYAYYSVSASLYHTVEDYILRQVKHHTKVTAEDEYNRIISKHAEISPNDTSKSLY